ncbi:hypothetical protein EYV94_00685 [Puteibacter caeruleilacunae]|nr:hypothetical protein EYV94_00685 [Puteibacter caeruleilacunae]
MKQIFIIALVIGIALTNAMGQKQGGIVFEQVINIHKNLSPEQQAYIAMLPEFSKRKYQFVFNEKQGVLKVLPQEQPEGMMIMTSGGGNDAFVDFKKQVYRNYIEVDGEVFCTEVPIIPVSEIKATGKTKKILNYECKEYRGEGTEFSLWICESLPAGISPMPPIFGNGAVLSMESDKLSFTAVSFSKGIDAKELTPKEAQVITAEQYKDLQEEKIGEMKAMSGSKVN